MSKNNPFAWEDREARKEKRKERKEAFIDYCNEHYQVIEFVEGVMLGAICVGIGFIGGVAYASTRIAKNVVNIAKEG